VSFGALIATLAAEVDFWTGADGTKVIDGVVIYFLVPSILALINATEIEVLEASTHVLQYPAETDRMAVLRIDRGAVWHHQARVPGSYCHRPDRDQCWR
jgi:hypothetical protein